MITYAFVNPDGLVTGGGIARELPEGAVRLTESFSLSDLPSLCLRDGVWEKRTDLPVSEDKPPSAEEVAIWQAAMLDRARAAAIARINAAAGALRLKVYTDIPGQDALYLEKRGEAQAFVAAQKEPETLADYPLMAGEIGPGLTAHTAYELAQIWLNRSHLFKQLGAATEATRLRAIYEVGAAADASAIGDAEARFHAALAAIPN